MPGDIQAIILTGDREDVTKTVREIIAQTNLSDKVVVSVQSHETAPETDDEALAQRALTRLKLSDNQVFLLGALYAAGHEGLTAQQIENETRLNTGQLNGVLGTLGRRINGTEGYIKGSHQFPVNVLISLERSASGDSTTYRLTPAARAAVEAAGVV